MFFVISPILSSVWLDVATCAPMLAPYHLLDHPFIPQTELASEGVLADLVTMFLGSLRLGRPTPPAAGPPPPSGSRSPQPVVRKTWFCLGYGSQIEMRGNPATQMDCMVPRMCLDVPVSPQTPPNPSFWAISQFSGILGRAPGHPLLALCGPIGPIALPW